MNPLFAFLLFVYFCAFMCAGATSHSLHISLSFGFENKQHEN